MSKASAFCLLLVVSLSPVAADGISDSLRNSTFDEIVRPEGSNAYVCTFIWDKQTVQVLYESDAGSLPTLLGYRKSGEKLEFLIKSDWVPNDGDSEDTDRYTWYYMIELKLLDGKPNIVCHRIDKLDLSGFKLNTAVVNDDNVNVRSTAGRDGKKVGQKRNGDPIAPIGIGSNQEKIGKYQDYWYSLSFNESQGWIFGSYVRFGKTLKLF